jgi:hypothetical protein
VVDGPPCAPDHVCLAEEGADEGRCAPIVDYGPGCDPATYPQQPGLVRAEGLDVDEPGQLGLLRDVAREFLNDWDVIMRPLSDPGLPLTNNAAERQLRHYVIARRISYGTRTLVGSNSMALLASVIDTCRPRGASATALLARAIHAARTGLPAPSLPPIAAHLL